MISIIECTRTSRLSIKNSFWQVRLLPLLRQIKINRGCPGSGSPTFSSPGIPPVSAPPSLSPMAMRLAWLSASRHQLGSPGGWGSSPLAGGGQSALLPHARGDVSPLTLGVLQGYLADKKQPPPRALQ